MLRRSELAILLVLAPGCSLVFPLRGDPPPDSPEPSGCPAFGTTPAFASRTLHIVTSRLCDQYTTSIAAGIGIGACRDDMANLQVFEGPIDEPPELAMITLKRASLHSAVITPEGTRLITVESDGNTNFAIETYQRSGAAWDHIAESPTQALNAFTLGTPTASPNAHLIVFDRATSTVVELQDVDNQWIQMPPEPSPFGAQPVLRSGLHLTANGLAVLFTGDGEPGKREIFYADRASGEQQFGAARRIEVEASDLFNDASLSNDCSRVYLAEFTGTSYVTQK